MITLRLAHAPVVHASIYFDFQNVNYLQTE